MTPSRLRHKTSVAAILALAAFVVLAGFQSGHPKPSVVPVRWELNFTSGDLRLHVDPSDGRAYWHFTYQVVNKTGKDQTWAPTFTLFTDAGEILASGREVPARVTDAIIELMGNPLIQDQNQIMGDIRQGDEYAKDGLVIWPARSLEVRAVSLFIAGISGETARVKNPISGENVLLQKTLQRDYIIRGEALARGTAPLELVDQTWILR